MFWVRKRNVSRRRFFYVPKTYVIIDSHKNRAWLVPIFVTSCPELISKIGQYFQKLKFEFSRFYCIKTGVNI